MWISVSAVYASALYQNAESVVYSVNACDIILHMHNYGQLYSTVLDSVLSVASLKIMGRMWVINAPTTPARNTEDSWLSWDSYGAPGGGVWPAGRGSSTSSAAVSARPA